VIGRSTLTPEQRQSIRLVFISSAQPRAILAIDYRSNTAKSVSKDAFISCSHDHSDKLIDAHFFPALEYPFNFQRLDLREYSLQEAHRVALFICPAACPVMWWTSIALFTVIDCMDFELGGGWSEGRSGDRAAKAPNFNP